MNTLLIIGAGGHGKVVADSANCTHQWEKIVFLDDQFPEVKKQMGFQIIGRISDRLQLLEKYGSAVVAIGDNARRIKLMDELAALGYQLPAIIHPFANVSHYAEIAEGSVVIAGAVINAGVRIGRGCIINTGATVDHDCNLAAGVHISPGVNLAGEVTVGEGSWIGTGAVVIPGISIGRYAVVGAGAVVISDVADKQKVVGVPARAISK